MSKRSFLWAVALFLLALPSVAANPAPVGAKFRVSTCTTCNQREPALAGVPSGEFFAAWAGQSGLDLHGVAGRLFKNTGAPKAPDFLINRGVLPPDQDDVAVAGDATGYVAAWASLLALNRDVFVQRYTLAGVATGSPILVNLPDTTTPAFADFNPIVAKTAGGGFVVAWVRFQPAGVGTNGTNPEVLLRRFNNSGVALGNPIKLNTNLVNGDRPDLCVDTTGQVNVVWTSADGFPLFQANHRGVSVRIVSAAGATVGNEIIVAQPLATLAPVAISCGKTGIFTVAWESDLPPSTDAADILGSRYSKVGRRLGTVFRINSLNAGRQQNPALSHDAAGNLVAVWQSDTGNGGGILGRRFSAANVAAGPDFLIDAYAAGETHSIEPDVAHVGTTGNFVVVFEDGLQGVFARRYTPSAIASREFAELDASQAAEEPSDELEN